MDKNKFAPTPPMGWNSYDYYDTTVNEEQVKANADYMAKHLKDYGWEYIVVDISGMLTLPEAKETGISTYPSGKVEIDEYSGFFPVQTVFRHLQE